MQAAVMQGEFGDWMEWEIHIRSLVWYYWPSDTEISVPVDTTVGFEVIPFELGEDDTLTYRWWLDGEMLDYDSTASAISVDFDEVSDHVVTCVLADTVDTDTVTWHVDVYHPADVSPPADATLPKTVNLYPPFPNPFNATATIRFDLPSPGNVRLELYDINGRLIDELANGEMPAGRHVVELDAIGLAAGVYFVRLDAGNSPQLTARKQLVQKVIVMK